MPLLFVSYFLDFDEFTSSYKAVQRILNIVCAYRHTTIYLQYLNICIYKTSFLYIIKRDHFIY